MNEPINLSVVVIGENEGDRLSACFQSIAKMQRPDGNIEVIYVDSNSVDHSLNVAKDFNVKVMQISEGECSPAKARNVGWKEARGNYILFLDGDTSIAPEFVIDSIDLFCDPKIAVVCGYCREIRPDASVYHKIADLDWIYPKEFSEFCGGNAIIRRDILEKIGGYDESLVAGEEPEMCRRIRERGYRISCQDKLIGYHDIDMKNFSQYWNRGIRSGYAFAEISEKYRNTVDPFWLRESRHNFLKIFVLLAVISLLIISYHKYGVFWPNYVLVLGFLVLIIKSTYKARKKSDDWLACFIYGIHSHFNHIPLFIGQLKYWISKIKLMR